MSKGWSLLQQRPARLEGWVRVSIAAGVPDCRRRDLDNLGKAMLDLLVAHQVIEDDSKVLELSSRWDDTIDPGRVLVTVKRAKAPASRIGAATKNAKREPHICDKVGCLRFL